MLQSVQRYCSLFRDVAVCCCLFLSAEEACAEGGLISICNHRNHMTPNTGLSLTNHSRYGMILTIHSIASAQSRVATRHLIVHKLLVILVVPVATEVPASMRRWNWLALMSGSASAPQALGSCGRQLQRSRRS